MTSASTPGRPPKILGTTSSRTSRTIARLARSFWPPDITTDTRATVPSCDGRVSTGPLSPSRATSSIRQSIDGLLRAGSSAFVTTTWNWSVEPSGHFSFMRLMAWTPSIESGNEAKSPWPMCNRRTGDARRSRNPAETTKDRSGRRMVDPHDPAPRRRSPPRAVGRGSGRRNRFTFSSRIDRSAGRNVSDPTTEMNTTEIVPIAIERNSGSSSRNRPPIEIITASPEKNTARPAVLEAVRDGRQLVAPLAARCGSA